MEIDGKAIIEHSPLPTFVVDSEGNVVLVNRAFLEVYDIPKKEIVLGKNALTEPTNVKYGVNKYIEKALSGKVVETPEVDFVTPHGVRRVTRSRLFPVFNGDSLTHVVVMHEDITERKIVEEKQLKTRKEAAAAKERADIVGAIPEIIFILDMDLNLIDWNETALKRSGYSSEEVEGHHALDFIVEGDREKMSEGVKEIIEKGQASREGRLLTKEGVEIPHSWSAKKVLDEDGEPIRIVGVGRDITERRVAEEREEFLHSLLRHDVRNKVQIVLGYLELAREHDLPGELESYLEKAEKATNESMDIIERVRAIQKAESEEVESVRVASVVGSALEESMISAHEKNIEIEIKCPTFESEVKGGPLLKELFVNLLGNSIRHSGGSKIKIGCQDLDEEVIYTIEDDGRGIPSDIRERVFERGFVSGESAGSGLGLFLVKMIAHSYEGRVEARDSELGGARFDVYLKKAEK